MKDLNQSERPAVPAPAGNGLRGLIYGSALYRLSLRGRAPARLRLPLPYSWPEDRAGAEALLDGAFLFAGRRYLLAEAGWQRRSALPTVEAALHGCTFLGDLRAVGSKVAQARARNMVDDWIAANRRWSLPAWRADVLGRRLAMWLVTADFLLHNADAAFVDRFLASATEQARHLRRIADGTETASAALAAVKGELAAALGLGVGRIDVGLARLARLIERRLLPAARLPRSPSLLLGILKDLLDIRACLQTARRPIPPQLVEAIARLASAVRATRLGDGGLGLFHGTKEEDPRTVDAVLARAGSAATAATGGAVLGFQRLQAGRLVLIVDAAAPVVDGGLHHAGPLAFELSADTDRLIVNCGAVAGDDEPWRRALRSTAAHSTVCVGDADAIVVGDGARRANGSVTVAARRRDEAGAVWLDAWHDGYRRRFGLIHHRRLYLDAGGDEVRGEEVLDGAADQAFAARFHVHPSVRASLVHDSGAVLLRTPGGGGWRFDAEGGDLCLRDGVYLGGSDVPRRTAQIVVSGRSRAGETHLRWILRRIGAR
jgi:uncharacterized heparinase superfamily protein